MKELTLEEFIESEYAEEIHRAIIGDSVGIEMMNKMHKYANTLKPNQLPAYINANFNRDEVEKSQRKIKAFEDVIRIRMDIVKEATIRHIIELHGGYSSAPNISYSQIYGKRYCSPDASVQQRLNIADQYPKEVTVMDYRIEEIIQNIKEIEIKKA